MDKIFLLIIKEICNEEKIKITVLSKDLVLKLEKNNVTKYINGYKFDLNSHALGLILDDKYATYDLLKSNNIKVVEHNILFNNNNNDYSRGCNCYNDCYNLFLKYNRDVVLKINNGTCGIDVYHIKDEEELQNKYNSLFKRNFSLSICPFYKIKQEYRVILLNNKIQLLYGKLRPIVFGNNKSTVKELLIDFNKSYFSNENNLKEIINWNYIPKKNEEYIYDWKFNLSRGSKMTEDISNKDLNIIKSLAIDTSKSIGLGFGSTDIIKTYDNNFYVLEINSGVMIKNYINQNKNGYEIAKEVYRNAIKEMFNI